MNILHIQQANYHMQSLQKPYEEGIIGVNINPIL